MVLRRLGYGIIMFMESRWHEIWGRYVEKLHREGVVGLPQTGNVQLKQQSNSITTSSCFLNFMPFLLKQDVGADMHGEISFYLSRPPSSQGHGRLEKFKKKSGHNCGLEKGKDMGGCFWRQDQTQLTVSRFSEVSFQRRRCCCDEGLLDV